MVLVVNVVVVLLMVTMHCWMVDNYSMHETPMRMKLQYDVGCEATWRRWRGWRSTSSHG